MTDIDLRADLGVRPEPDFDMTLPPGWARHGVDQGAQDVMLAELRRRLMEQHKPALYAELKSMVEQAFAQMRRDGAHAVFSAADSVPGTLWIPASIIASTRRAEPGQTLDDLVRALIREQGATPLRGDKSTVRFERERVIRLGTETVVNQSVIYLIPVPGTRRRRALQLVAGFGRSVDTPADDPNIAVVKALFDACVSSLRWRAPEAP